VWRGPPSPAYSGAIVLKLGRIPAVSLLLLFFAVASAQTGGSWKDRRAQVPADDRQATIMVNGSARTYILHVPSNLPADGLKPLVLVFHGGGGHARNMPNFTGFDHLADAEQFIVAYPESFNKRWNDTRGLSPADDVAFIRSLIAHLQSSLSIDPKAVYAAGISNGGFFSNRLACDLTDKISAIASVAATMPETLIPACKPNRPISVMYIHGKNDPIVHIEGGPVMRNHGNAVSLEQAVKFWRDWDHTSAPPKLGDLPDEAHDGTTVHRTIYSGGAQGSEVIVYVIDGGGHTWPGGPQYLPRFMVGKASHNLQATKVIWEFFKEHKMP
jgi:polyhydroxybutyrate depolymerase